MMPIKIYFSLLFSLCVLLLSACSRLPGVYKLDIQQGPILEQGQINKLSPGMTREQVQFVMGTPSISDIFHADRWDYVYTLEENGTLSSKKQLTLWFENNLLASLQGDYRPGEEEPESTKNKEVLVVPPNQRKEKPGFFRRFLQVISFGTLGTV